jgi:hypothetical protein
MSFLLKGLEGGSAGHWCECKEIKAEFALMTLESSLVRLVSM